MDTRIEEYTFFWFIENYSYCLHKNTDRLVSPEFTADGLDGTSWTIRLYPRGCTDEDMGYISLFLSRSDDDSGAETVLMKYELSVLARNGLELNWIRTEHGFEKGSAHGSRDFLSIHEVLLHRKSEYLPEDTLSVRCRIWNGEGSFHKSPPICARTRIGIEKISFLHVVEGFSNINSNERKTIQVQPDAINGCVLSCSLYCTNGPDRDGTVMVDIVPSDKDKVLSKCDIFLLSAFGTIINCGEADGRSGDTRKNIEKVCLSLTKEMIVKRKKQYLVDDNLSLLFKCTFATGLEFQKIEGIQHGTFTAAIRRMGHTAYCKDAYKVVEKLSACPSALDDLKDIYSNAILADFELKTKTKTFPAHKVVLCARSPVFNAMLSNDMMEKRDDSLLVDDLDDVTVQQLLLFLYSDKLENLEWDSAVKLFYAADKYQIEKLRLVCSSFLIDHLSVSTAANFLLLADTHNDCDLKKVAENFIFQNEQQVFASEEWENFTSTNPQLAIKTMLFAFKGKSW